MKKITLILWFVIIVVLGLWGYLNLKSNTTSVPEEPMIPPAEEVVIETPQPTPAPKPAKEEVKETPKPITPEPTPAPAPVLLEKPGAIVGTAPNAENVFNAINRERYELGVKILVRDPALDNIANDKLQDMLEKDYFAHTSPNGDTFSSWLDRNGYVYTWAGENLACGSVDRETKKCLYNGVRNSYDTIDKLVTAWMNSPTHRANIVKPQYTRTGIAISGSLTVQVFVGL